MYCVGLVFESNQTLFLSMDSIYWDGRLPQTLKDIRSMTTWTNVILQNCSIGLAVYHSVLRIFSFIVKSYCILRCLKFAACLSLIN